MKFRGFIPAATLLLIATLACSVTAPNLLNATQAGVSTLTPAPATLVPQRPTPEPMPVLEGKIAYSTQRGGMWQVVVMNADGSDEYSLTEGYGQFARPAWSPEGKRLAARMEIEMGSGIGVMGISKQNGKLSGEPIQTVYSGFSDAPRWSPNGQQIVFSGSGGGGWLTYTADVNNGSLNLIPNIPENATDPDWSPDGQKIIFANYADQTAQIRDLYSINLDGSGLQQLTNTPEINEESPIWSPDGQHIVFTSNESSPDNYGSKDIYIMNSDGSNVIRVTTDPGSDFDPSWSPDGKKVVFVSDRHDNNNSNYEVYIINADGTGEMRITNNKYTDRWPTWRAALSDDPQPTACQPQMRVDADVNIPAGTRFTSPQKFNKIWRVTNTGSCTWTPTDYSLQANPDNMLASVGQTGLPGAIQPGASVDIVIPLNAPAEPGSYHGEWQLVNSDGMAVPGADGNPANLTAQIEVLAPGQSVLPEAVYFLLEQTGSSQVWRMDADGRTLTQVTNEYQPVVSLDVSPDGKLAYVSQNQVIITDPAEKGRQVIATLGEDAWRTAVAWSPDGTRLAYPLGGVHIYDTNTATDIILVADNDVQGVERRSYEPYSWSPDSSKMMMLTYLWEAAAFSYYTIPGAALLETSPTGMSAWSNDNQSVFLANAYTMMMGGSDPGLAKVLVSPGDHPAPIIENASVWWPIQKADSALQYFASPLIQNTGEEYTVFLYASAADGNNPSILDPRPLLLEQNDGFTAFWASDGSGYISAISRPALNTSEVMYYTADSNPPVYLMQQGTDFKWGK